MGIDDDSGAGGSPKEESPAFAYEEFPKVVDLKADGGRGRRKPPEKSCGEPPSPLGWELNACFNSKGEIVPNLASAMAAMRGAPEISECFAFDEMFYGPVLAAPLPGLPPAATAGFSQRAVRDEDVTQLQEWLQKEAGLTRIIRETVHQAVDLRARERAFHPVRQYLDSLKWDRRKRLEKWLTYYLGVEKSEYATKIGELLFIALVARIYKPGCKQDYLPIFEGPQGSLKSEVCKVIAGEWFSDCMPDLVFSKDVSQHLAGKWLIEIGELAALSRPEAAALKAFVTRTTERYRPSYGRKEIVQLRQCCFWGTTNEEFYLRDYTGGRRFWPIRIVKIDIEALTRDRDQLFAEAVDLFMAGAKWWPDGELEHDHIKIEQEARFETDAWEEVISPWLVGKDRVTVCDVARFAILLETCRIGTAEQRRIAAVLKHLGWVCGGRDWKGRFYKRSTMTTMTHDA